MSYQQFGDHRQQFLGLNSFHRAPEEQEQRQLRNSMKRPRGYSPPAFHSPNDTLQTAYPSAKRVRRVSGTEALGFASNQCNNGINSGLFVGSSKSDDEISLAEEAQITPTALPHHSIFAQGQHNKQKQQLTQIYHQQQQQQQQQSQSQFGHQQAVASVTGTQFPPGNSESGISYATDYQPMNSLLGNLHAMRQQRRQASAQSSHEHAQTRHHAAIIRQQQQEQEQHNHYHHQYGNHFSVPKTNANNNGSGSNRSRKKIVSLRVNSNLY